MGKNISLQLSQNKEEKEQEKWGNKRVTEAEREIESQGTIDHIKTSWQHNDSIIKKAVLHI